MTNSMNQEVLLALKPKEFHKKLFCNNLRIDNRRFDELREINLELGAIKTADASALVRWGQTTIICGCCIQLSKKTTNSTIKEDISNNPVQIDLELPCMSLNNLHVPPFLDQQVNNKLRDLINESNCINLESLQFADEYWSLEFKIVCLNYDAALLEASLFAFFATLKSIILPPHPITKEQRSIDINFYLLSLSYSFFEEIQLLDPCHDEELVSTSTITIVLEPVTKNLHLIEKIGGTGITDERLEECLSHMKRDCESMLSILDRINCPVKMS